MERYRCKVCGHFMIQRRAIKVWNCSRNSLRICRKVGVQSVARRRQFFNIVYQGSLAGCVAKGNAF